MVSNLINTREDLDAIAGTPEHAEFMALLKGTMNRVENQAIYPQGYGQADYTGPVVDPVWVQVEDLSVIGFFGFAKGDFL